MLKSDEKIIFMFSWFIIRNQASFMAWNLFYMIFCDNDYAKKIKIIKVDEIFIKK